MIAGIFTPAEIIYFFVGLVSGVLLALYGERVFNEKGI